MYQWLIICFQLKLSTRFGIEPVFLSKLKTTLYFNKNTWRLQYVRFLILRLLPFSTKPLSCQSRPDILQCYRQILWRDGTESELEMDYLLMPYQPPEPRLVFLHAWLCAGKCLQIHAESHVRHTIRSAEIQDRVRKVTVAVV